MFSLLRSRVTSCRVIRIITVVASDDNQAVSGRVLRNYELLVHVILRSASSGSHAWMMTRVQNDCNCGNALDLLYMDVTSTHCLLYTGSREREVSFALISCLRLRVFRNMYSVHVPFVCLLRVNALHICNAV